LKVDEQAKTIAVNMTRLISLRAMPRKETDFPAGPLGWICGDLHLENSGSYRSANDQVYFDLNDFDEAILAQVTREVIRLVMTGKPDYVESAIKRSGWRKRRNSQNKGHFP
jgi:hypothetical protein